MKMFKKKGELLLPPLPKVPTYEMMLEDIMGTGIDDPVFFEGCCNKMFEERSSVDVKFQTFKDFIQAKQRLNNLILDIDNKLMRIHGRKCELQEMTETIKQQASDALK